VGYDINYTDRLMNTYAKIATSSPMLDNLMTRLGLSTAPSVKVEIIPSSELIQISMEHSDPVIASNGANILANFLIDYALGTDSNTDIASQKSLGDQLAQAENEVKQARREYERLVAETPNNSDAIGTASRLLKVKEDTYASVLQLFERIRVSQSVHTATITFVESAAIPLSPSQPKKALNMTLGLLVGLMAGICLAFLLENLDTTLYATKQIEMATERVIIGKIPSAKLHQDKFLNGHSPAGEAFRHVRTSLLNLEYGGPLHMLLVTSAEPGEGKSTIALNLAYTLTEFGRKVLLVDCDLRAPTLHKVLGMSNDLGLSNVLNQGIKLHEAVHCEPKSGLRVLTSGGLPQNPAELLGSSEMAAFTKQAMNQFEIIVLDTPSLLAVTDASVLAPMVDVVVMVVGRGKARRNAVREACRMLDGVKAKRVGIVVNHSEPESDARYYHNVQSN
jgi:capsular exopolysaccharide synthesis family protein